MCILSITVLAHVFIGYEPLRSYQTEQLSQKVSLILSNHCIEHIGKIPGHTLGVS